MFVLLIKVGSVFAQELPDDTVVPDNTNSAEIDWSEEIQLVSDYLFYQLDEWGRENSNSIEDQCVRKIDCFNEEIGFERCCAEIFLTLNNADQAYLRRCLNVGLLAEDLNVTLDDLNFIVHCDTASLEVETFAIGLSVTTALSIAIFTVF